MRPQDIFGFIIYVAVGIYLIVEAESVGQMRGSVRMHRVSSPTPGCLVRFFGCTMLAVFPGGMVATVLDAWWAGLLVGLAVAIGIYVLTNRLLGA
ncbi:MAG: hypothetical protein ACOX9R_09320 [Armatimonadota bacterium]|jgi:hypothetical protein